MKEPKGDTPLSTTEHKSFMVGKKTMKLLTWTEFDSAVIALAMRALWLESKSIAGIPRGGLVVAVAVSHASGLPMVSLQDADRHTLIVDDIADSGETISRMNTGEWAVWVRRASCPIKVWSVLVEGSDAWLIFPWEDASRARVDYEAYQRRMNEPAAAE